MLGSLYFSHDTISSATIFMSAFLVSQVLHFLTTFKLYWLFLPMEYLTAAKDIFFSSYILLGFRPPPGSSSTLPFLLSIFHPLHSPFSRKVIMSESTRSVAHPVSAPKSTVVTSDEDGSKREKEGRRSDELMLRLPSPSLLPPPLKHASHHCRPSGVPPLGNAPASRRRDVPTRFTPSPSDSACAFVHSLNGLLFKLTPPALPSQTQFLQLASKDGERPCTFTSILTLIRTFYPNEPCPALEHVWLMKGMKGKREDIAAYWEEERLRNLVAKRGEEVESKRADKEM